MKIKFTLIDYIIIILVIVAIIFAFIHITSDDADNIEKTAFDESTINKIPDTYLKYYKNGIKVTATVEGYNSSNNEKISLTGEVIWSDNSGNDVKLLIKNENGTYLTGFYRYNPNVDIYIDQISLESNDEKYPNLVEIKTNGKEINSLNDLTSGIGNNSNFEISTKISLDSLDKKAMQKITNKLQNEKRLSIKTSTSDMDNQIVISKATKENINNANAILGNIDGMSGDITIRIYNCSDKDIKMIEDNYNVVNILRF